MTRKRRATKATKRPTKKVAAKRKASPLEGRLLEQIIEAGVPEPQREFRFHPTRKWRFDFAWPDAMIAVEVEGAVFSGGRHSRGAGMVADMDKYNTAALLGWTVLRVASPHITKGEAIEWIIEAVG